MEYLTQVTEEVFSVGNFSAMQSGDFDIPNTIPNGEYRARLRSVNGSNSSTFFI